MNTFDRKDKAWRGLENSFEGFELNGHQRKHAFRPWSVGQKTAYNDTYHNRLISVGTCFVLTNQLLPVIANVIDPEV